jgi:hypothetical protein
MFLKISRSNTIKKKSLKRSQKAVLKVSTENDKVSKFLVSIWYFHFWVQLLLSLSTPIHYDRFGKFCPENIPRQMTILGTKK